MVRISYDRDVDALYIRLKETTVTTDRVEEGVALDYDAADSLAGIEILDAGKRLDYRESGKGFGLAAIESHEQTGLSTSPSLQLTANQMQVLDALRRVETEEYRLGDWYLGALYALENPYNPDRISQAAQSLRELIEKLPRVVRESDVQSPPFSSKRQQIRERFLKDTIRYKDGWKGEKIDARLDKTLKSIDEYLQLSQQPTRKEKIQIAIVNIDPMAGQMGENIQKQKRDALHGLWNIMEGFAHHRSNKEEDEQNFRVHLATLEQMVYDLLAPITSKDQDEIQTILNRPEHPEADAATLYKLISRRGANYVYFFTHAADSYWIPHLKNKGFFRDPPKAEYSSDDYVNLPFWPEIQYLNRVCESAPDEVLQLVQELPAVDNPRVYENILDIALKFEGTRSAKLKPKMIEYAKLENQFLPFQFPKLLAHWTSERQTEAALELANVLVQFVPDPKAEEKQKQKRQMKGDEISSVEDEFASVMTILRPLPRFNENYGAILNEGVRPLAEKEPYKVARMLINTTATMICLGKHDDDLESDRDSDYSEIWCPRLDIPKDDYPDLNESLIQALTLACEKSFERESESIEALDSALRDQRWVVFKRIRQHLFAKYLSEQTRPWIRELILKHPDYGRWEHHYEFQRMIRSACVHFGAQLLTEDERRQIFDAILSGPPEEDFREWLGDKFTEIEFRKRREYFHHQQLRPFAPVLFGEYADYFNQLEADESVDEITDESYQPYGESKGGRVKTRSPVSTQDLASLSDEKLLEYINNWEDEYWDRDDKLTEINIEALAGAFQKVFEDSIIPDAERLDFWIDNQSNIRRPIYIRVMVDAMKDNVKTKHFDRLDKWFAFCRWVLKHRDTKNEKLGGVGRQGDGSSEQPSWHTSRRAVCDFVETCIEEDVGVPLSARENLVGLLEKLCMQYDWRLDNDKPVLLNRDDNFTEAINTTRGRALENLVKFGYWVHYHDNNAEVPEIRQILEKRVSADAAISLTLPEYAILGMRFGSLLHLDEQWTKSRRLLLLPRNDLPAWREAFGNFLRYNRPFRPIFDELRGDFEFALEHLGSLGEQKGIGRELTLKLGQHLFTYYLWEVYPLKGDQSLLERYYLKTGGVRKHWATLFNYVGHSLQNSGKQLGDGLKERIVTFFESRLETGDPVELREYAAWIKAECLDAEWRLDALSEVLDVDGILSDTGTLEEGRVEHPRTWLAHEVTRSMPTLLSKHTPRVVACFARLTDALPTSDRSYIPTDDAKAILKSGLGHDDETVRENAQQARENLLRRGYFSIMD